MANVFTTWKLTVYKGKYSKYKHEVLAVKLQSEIIPEAEQVFLYDTFNLEFGKKVKPFMAMFGSVDSSTENTMHIRAEGIIDAWMLVQEKEKKSEDVSYKLKELAANFKQLPCECEINGVTKNIKDINELLGSAVGDDEITKYYNNIKQYVRDNISEFAVRKLSKASNSSHTNKVLNVFKEYSGYTKNKHLGAFLIDEQYTKQYQVTNRSKAAEYEEMGEDVDIATLEKCLESACYPLALRVEQFKILTDMSNSQHQVKDVVEAFVQRKYILTGEKSNTIEKDLMLASGVQERCYILDLGVGKAETE